MITLPDDLNQRMSKHSEVNWSRVAADAFEKKLGEIENRPSQKKEILLSLKSQLWLIIQDIDKLAHSEK